MSVNYYAFGPSGGELDGEGLHIGQAAGSFRFLLRAHPDRGLTSFAEWKNSLFRKDVTIRAESGYEVSAQDMEMLILQRQDRAGRPLRARFGIRGPSRPGQIRDAEGYELYDGEFC
ncbi:hypothetical protein [Streptomyces sp. CC224B]|uniref:hypothetical protein n=1 Tax=Streptomyces sp. CC224B TaxID=3044571 RepID=UPI0024A92279|nr:hypothetical protein [Streptomyces sp. CC224B]